MKKIFLKVGRSLSWTFFALLRHMLKIQLYGIARDFLNKEELLVQDQKDFTVGALRSWLTDNHPVFSRLPHFMIAVNQTYAVDSDSITETDEIAIIPPVSGG